MADEPEGTTAPSTDVSANVEVEAEPTPPDGDHDEWRNPAEIKKWAKVTRQTRKDMQAVQGEIGDIKSMLSQFMQAGKGALSKEDEPKREAVRAKDVRDELRAHQAELSFREELDELDRPLTKRQRNMLLRLYRAERPSVDDLPDWIAANTEAFPADKPKPEIKEEPKEKPPQAPNVSNTGAPAADPRNALPLDIFAADATAWKALSPKEKRERYEAYKRSRGHTGNPFAARKTTQ